MSRVEEKRTWHRREKKNPGEDRHIAMPFRGEDCPFSINWSF